MSRKILGIVRKCFLLKGSRSIYALIEIIDQGWTTDFSLIFDNFVFFPVQKYSLL